MSELARPPFITEEAWGQGTDAQRADWFRYARDLADLMEDPRFRNVAGRWVDELCGVFAPTLAFEETGLTGHTTLMALREGHRQPGLKMIAHMEAVAPKFWMRTLYEMRNARTRVETEPPERPEE